MELFPPNNCIFDRSRTVAFTGHRASSLPWGGDERSEGCIKLKQALEKAICSAYREGKRVFLSGMAGGFDIYAAETVLALREKLPGIRLVCVFPCPSDDRRSLAAASRAGASICLCNEFTAGCMLSRNRFLVEHSSLIIACYDGRLEGGTYWTLKLAVESGLRVVLTGLF